AIKFYCDYFSYVHFGMQAGGKYILCGSTGRDDDADIFVTRYNEDGTVDESFGKKGIIYMDLAGYKDVPVFLKILPDDKILIGAMADNAYSYRTLKGNMMLVRLNADGTADMQYADKGRITEKPDRRYKGLMAAAISSEGNTYLLRRYDFRNQFDFGVTAYGNEGRLIESFGNSGSINGSIRKFDDNGMDICLQKDGKILVTGQSHSGPSDVALAAKHNPVDVYLVRFNADGSPDAGFANNGKITTDRGSGQHTPRRVCSTSDGRILIAGSVSQQRKQGDVFVYAFNTNGHPDTLFSGRGVLRLRYSSNDQCDDMVVDTAGKFYIAGSIRRNGDPNVFVSRFNADGSIDTSFNRKGQVVVDYISEQPKITLQPDGKILVGVLSTIDRRNYYVLSRFLPDGRVDSAFGKKSE
ncbi:MAG: hypothetical protein EOO00_10825, partial [Chitinophagaceae bacterium]